MSATITDLAAGLTDDVVVADQAGHLTRFDATGALLSTFHGNYGFAVSNIAVDAQNDLDYASFDGTGTTNTLSFTKVDRCAGTVFAVSDTQPMSFAGPLSDFRGLGTDAAGNVSALLYPWDASVGFNRLVYDYSSTGASRGTTFLPEADVTSPSQTYASLTPDGDVVVGGVFYGSGPYDLFGCGPLAYPSPGTMAMARLDVSGACHWQKALAVPGPEVQYYAFAAGADGSLAFAVIYAGTADFGGGVLTSSGTSSLALARFDGAGNHLWSKSFGGAGSNFTLGTLQVNAAGTMLVSAGYTGAVDLGAGALPSGNDTLVAAFDACGNLRWSKAAMVGSGHKLLATAGTCGAFVATDSPTVDLGTGPLATSTSLGVAGLGL
jgi:hypothetical protein